MDLSFSVSVAVFTPCLGNDDMLLVQRLILLRSCNYVVPPKYEVKEIMNAFVF